MGTFLPVLMVFVGCCSNVVFLELLVRESPSCGTTATFTQFLLLSIDGFIRTSKFGTAKRAIPISAYLVMVSLFFVTSIVNNLAFNFNISMPLHLIFRSGSLMANLTLGVLLLRKSYPPSKYISVSMISIGICMATLASVHNQESTNDYNVNPSDNAGNKTVIGGDGGDVGDVGDGGGNLINWFIGIGILTVALFLSALMGLYQEDVYKRYGKHSSEALFYNHALPLPFFLLFYKDLLHHVHVFSQSEALLPGLIPIPKLWVYIVANMITQYVCIKSVFILTTECASLTVTLVVTLRKFVSLIFSILYFANPFTTQHWLATVLVFGGTLMFSGVFDAFWGNRGQMGGVGGRKDVGWVKKNDDDGLNGGGLNDGGGLGNDRVKDGSSDGVIQRGGVGTEGVGVVDEGLSRRSLHSKETAENN